LVAVLREIETAIHKEILHFYRHSADGNCSRSRWYEVPNSGQGEAEHLGRAPELGCSTVRSHAELAGSASSGTKQLWLILEVEPALLCPAKGLRVESEAQEASPPILEGRSAATGGPACAGASPCESMIEGAGSSNKCACPERSCQLVSRLRNDDLSSQAGSLIERTTPTRR
jgi:hypothetical protein